MLLQLLLLDEISFLFLHLFVSQNQSVIKQLWFHSIFVFQSGEEQFPDIKFDVPVATMISLRLKKERQLKNASSWPSSQTTV